MPSKYGFGNTIKKSPVYKKPIYGEAQRNPIMKKETLPGIDAKLDAKNPIRQNGDFGTKLKEKTDAMKTGVTPPSSERISELKQSLDVKDEWEASKLDQPEAPRPKAPRS